MKLQEYIYMHECNKAGIRVYPVLRYGFYHLVVERNKTDRFLPGDIIGRPKEGEQRYDPTTKEWTLKILELYKHLYHTQVMPKLQSA